MLLFIIISLHPQTVYSLFACSAVTYLALTMLPAFSSTISSKPMANISIGVVLPSVMSKEQHAYKISDVKRCLDVYIYHIQISQSDRQRGIPLSKTLYLETLEAPPSSARPAANR